MRAVSESEASPAERNDGTEATKTVKITPGHSDDDQEEAKIMTDQAYTGMLG